MDYRDGWLSSFFHRAAFDESSVPRRQDWGTWGLWGRGRNTGHPTTPRPWWTLLCGGNGPSYALLCPRSPHVPRLFLRRQIGDDVDAETAAQQLYLRSLSEGDDIDAVTLVRLEVELFPQDTSDPPVCVQIPAHRGQSFRRIADSIPVIADSF
jgi:hypothetical protein